MKDMKRLAVTVMSLFLARFGVLPHKPENSCLWLGDALGHFKDGHCRAEIGSVLTHASA